MSTYTKITKLPQSLIPLYFTQQSFWNRFFKTERIQDQFARVYDICDDIFHNNVKVAVKDYSSYSNQQCQNVIDNLNFYSSISKIEELCKLVAFCQQEVTGDIKAAFQYQDISLEEVINQRLFKKKAEQLYILILSSLFNSIKHFKQININLQDLILTNILFFKADNSYKLKILYDQRQKKYDKIQQGLKTFCSPQKINTAVQENKQIDCQNCQEIIFQLGLLVLDIVYLYESTNDRNEDRDQSKKGSHLSKSILFKGYLTFQDYTTCCLNNHLIQAKLEYLSSLNNNFITQLIILIKKMLNNPSQRISLSQLESSINLLQKMTTKDIGQIEIQNKQGTISEISPIKSKQSSSKRQDSLKYSDSRQQLAIKKTIQSQTTMPNSLNLLEQKLQIQYEKASQQNSYKNKNHQFCIIPKQKLLKSTHHQNIKNKLQMFIIELQNKVNLDCKKYFDGNVYYGEIDTVKQTREGLGIYLYHYGDVYFGNWKFNHLVSGCYIFKQKGDCFDGTVKNGKQGLGTYYYANGNIYQGNWLDDYKQGQGKMFYFNGDSYDGDWLKGKRSGNGSYFFNNGTIYRGGFLNGKKNGFGTIDFTDGTKVEANWTSNHIEGKGKINYKNGDYFQGIFNFSLKQGEGFYSWGDQIKYEGNFKKDLMQGFAKISYIDNQYYEGHIFEGRKEGQGFYKYSNGDTFKGQWKHDQKYSGQYYYKTGAIFEGKFSKGQMSYGVMVYPNGQSYQGQFQNGQRNGFGVYRSQSGSILFEGQWINDQYIKKY